MSWQFKRVTSWFFRITKKKTKTLSDLFTTHGLSSSLAYNPQSCFLYDLYIPMSYQRALVVCGKTYVSLLALKCVQIWHLQSSINPHASLFHFAGACWETWHNTNAPLTCSQTGTWYTACCAAIPRSSWKTPKSAICIGCHQAWSSFRPADLDTGSHSAAAQCAQKGDDSRGSDKDLAKTPSLYIFSVLVGGQKTTPPPVLTLCALSGAPHHLSFLYYCVGWLCNSQWGSWTTGAGAFST